MDDNNQERCTHSDVMVDLETLGTRPGSIILSIGAVSFGPEGLGREFYQVISTHDCKRLGLTTDGSTIMWWDEQMPEAREVLDQAADVMIAKELAPALLDFGHWLRNFNEPPHRIKMWANGSDFDNVLLLAAYRVVPIEPPWRFYNHRCFRTLKNLYPHIVAQPREGIYHNALDDAKYQARHAIQLLAAAHA